MGFYDISAGEIRIDGRNLADMNRDEARELFAMVLQETWLFRGTVAENVAYGRPQATREEIVKACDEAYCDHFIRTLPQGYDTVVGDESHHPVRRTEAAAHHCPGGPHRTPLADSG